MLRQDRVIVRNLYIIIIDTDKVKITRYDIYNIARRLRYTDPGIHLRRRLSYYRDEYLIYGGISADDYAILAISPAGGDKMRC